MKDIQTLEALCFTIAYLIVVVGLCLSVKNITK